jgi:hypothetical protein
MSGTATVDTFMVAVLFAAFESSVAPVVPVTVDEPAAVGVPLTWQVTVAPTGTALPATHAALPGLMEHAPCVTPAGRPVTAQEVPLTALARPWLLQVKLPL